MKHITVVEPCLLLLEKEDDDDDDDEYRDDGIQLRYKPQAQKMACANYCNPAARAFCWMSIILGPSRDEARMEGIHELLYPRWDLQVRALTNPTLWAQ